MFKIQNTGDLFIHFPIKTAADIQDGALLMPGVTAETDLGTAILASGAGADAIGTMDGLYDYSEVGTSLVTGATWVYGRVKPVFKEDIIRVQYDVTDTMALASDESSKTITITSLEDNIDTSYLYCVSGTGRGQLRFIDTSSSGSCTIRTAGSPEWDTADTCIKILRIFHQVAKLNSTATKLGTDAAAGTWTVCVLRNMIQKVGSSALEELNPTKHEINGLYDSSLAQHASFYSDLIVRNTAGHTVD